MRLRCRAAAATIAIFIAAGPVVVAQADTGLWMVRTDTCTPNGKTCIRGLVKDGAPFPSLAACEQHAKALLRRYLAANLTVSYLGCVRVQ